MIDRIISARILKLSQQFPVVVLTGARQTGKTTVLRDVFSDYSYVSLDLPSVAEMAEEDPAAFLAQYPRPLLIDEAQYAPGLFRHLKVIVDENRDLRGQFILTGSQKFNLMKEVSDSLAGRCAWLELEGLSFAEMSSVGFEWKDYLTLLASFCRGSMPQLWAESDVSVVDYYRSYLATYLERDVRQLINVTSLRDFERFIRLCASRNGQLLNKSDLAQGVGVAVNTVNQWLSVLEASNQIYFLEPFWGNTGKRIVKTPKLYFNDVGMLTFLLGLTSENIESSTFLGAIWETVVIGEFRKCIKNQSPESQLWFYRDNQGKEVDALLINKGKMDFIEIKWSAKPKREDSSIMLNVRDEMNQNESGLYQSGDCYLISRSPVQMKVNGVYIENLDYFLK